MKLIIFWTTFCIFELMWIGAVIDTFVIDLDQFIIGL